MSFSLRERIRGWVQPARRSRTPVLPLVFVAITVLAVVLTVTLPIVGLPKPIDTGPILGTLLTAQAAIAALTLAVTLFMMQGIRARRDVDDRMYREYVRRSRVRDILWASLLAVGVTGALLLTEGFMNGDAGTTDVKPELGNFLIASGVAFLLNLVLAGILFERAILYSRPEQWKALRRDITKADVREAIQAFLRPVRETDESGFTTLSPDQGEGSADEAVRALLDDARGAMSERRHEDLRRSLDSVRELVEYAMDEIKATGTQWNPPGSQPEWPPLRELSRNLYSFREDVIRASDREYISEVQRFDYMLTAKGMRERCGELFSVGLNGYRWNYQIANQIRGGQFRERLRDGFALDGAGFIHGAEPKEAFPYAREIVKCQERLLSDAMHSDQSADYHQLHKGFQGWLNAVRLRWKLDNQSPTETSELYRQLEQEYRIALMGLGGRALSLAKSNSIASVNPYVEVGRLAYAHLGLMAEDLASALAYDDSRGFSLWREWETEGAVQYQAITISPERYPLLFFSLRLMESSSEAMPTLGLHGRAQRVLDWFVNNSEPIQDYVRAELGPTLEQRRELATEALRSAVRRDEIAEDYEIIERELSETRIEAFKSEIYAAAFSENSVERLFDRADAALYLPGDAVDAPKERGIAKFVQKAFLTDTPEGAPIAYGPLEGDQWGRALSGDVLQRFCEALEVAPEIVAPLESPAALLEGIDRAMEDLNCPEQVVVVLAGDWLDLQVGLDEENPEGYEAEWRLLESDRIGEVGRYRGHPILNNLDYQERCVYVIDPTGWGNFVRAKADGDQDLRVEIKPISLGRARQFLKAKPDHFASEPNEESKLRKLQTYVEIEVGARTEFRVTDTARARRVVPVHQSTANNEVPQS